MFYLHRCCLLIRSISFIGVLNIIFNRWIHRLKTLGFIAFTPTYGLSFMVRNHAKLQAVYNDFVFRGLDREDVGNVLIRHRVQIGLMLQKSIHPAHPQGHFGTVVWMRGQRRGRRLLALQKQLQRRPAGGVVHMHIGAIGQPPGRQNTARSSN